jgi:16S rRNA (cytosine967-C5)-methyltransferase
MTPGARLQATVVLLDAVLSSNAPADRIVTQYFRQCRYMGSTDRRVISESVYQILRRYEELTWYLQGIPSHKQDWARLLALAYTHKIQGMLPDQIQALCQGAPFAPAPLSPVERMLLKEMGSLEPGAMPLPVRLNIPAWTLPHLEATFGDETEAAVSALNQPASLDLRVNTLKTTRDRVLKQLGAEGFEAIPTPWSPVGIRLEERRPLSGHELWKKGEIEVQDEGSQLLALLVDARPGMAVIDYCAGAGGKTLAMAATMENRGRIVATDLVEWRLGRSRERLRRAGTHNVEFRSLSDEATVKWLKRQAARFDRVLVDAPCSGSGTWRRNPDLKRRFSEKDLSELIAKQQLILGRAAPLVKPGGRLVYATCSLFKGENDNQITEFLNTHPNFHLIPVKEIWLSIFTTPFPGKEDTLQLTPHIHQVDGFFMAVMELKA